MKVPFISELLRRKGSSGGGGAKGGSSSSSGKSSGGSSSSKGTSGSTGSASKAAPKTVSLPKSIVGGKTTAVAYGSGTTKSTTIPSGQLFAGRTAGGATRGQVFGTSRYGSGYPGINGIGVGGRNFPYFFWPIIYSIIIGESVEEAYLYDTEYGESNNSSRPGGPLAQAPFESGTSNNTFYIVADNTTVVSLISSIVANCSSLLTSSANSTQSMPYNSSSPTQPRPEQAVQYYRASSIVLTEVGYNNSATFSNDSNAPNTPLPASTNSTLLDCLNQTIGAAAPLIDGASTSWQSSHVTLGGVGLLWMFLWTLGTL